jgi:hypothetical protein
MGVRRGNAQAAMSKSRTNGHLPHVAKSLGDPSEYLPPQDLGTAFAVHVKTSPRIFLVAGRSYPLLYANFPAEGQRNAVRDRPTCSRHDRRPIHSRDSEQGYADQDYADPSNFLVLQVVYKHFPTQVKTGLEFIEMVLSVWPTAVWPRHEHRRVFGQL